MRTGPLEGEREKVSAEESLCLRIVPESAWRQGVVVSECKVPIPCLRHLLSPTEVSTETPLQSPQNVQNKPESTESASLSVITSSAETEHQSGQLKNTQIHPPQSPLDSHSKARNPNFNAYVLTLKRLEGLCKYEVFRSTSSALCPDPYTDIDLDSKQCKTESVTSSECEGEASNSKGVEFSRVYRDNERVFLVAPIPRSASIAVAEITFLTPDRHIDSDQRTETGTKTIIGTGTVAGTGMWKGTETGTGIGTGTGTGMGMGIGTGAPSDSPGSFAGVSPSKEVSSVAGHADQDSNQYINADPCVHIVVRVMSIIDILNACLPLDGNSDVRESKAALRQHGHDLLLTTVDSQSNSAECDLTTLIDHSIVKNLQKNVLLCILSIFESTIFRDSDVKQLSQTIQDNNRGDIVDSESRSRDISMIKTLSTFLCDTILLDEKHLPVIEGVSLTPQMHVDIKRGENDRKSGNDNDNDNDKEKESVKVTMKDHNEALISTNEHQSLVPFSPSVLHMMSAIHPSTTVRVLNDDSSSMVICVPFDCSISSSTPAGVYAGPSNITSEERENSDNLVDKLSINAFNLRLVTDPHDAITEGQGQGQGQMAVTFAMGFSLVYTDKHTPYGCVTVLTVAYHSDEITRACSTYSTYSARKPSDDVRARIEPMHITVSDTTSVSYASTVSTASTGNGDVIGARHVGVDEAVTVTEERLRINTFDHLGDSIITDDTRTKLDVSASEKNKAEGGLFGFVVEEITFALSGMFFNARQHVLLSQAWNVLHSDYLIPLNTSVSKSHGMFSDSNKNSPMGGGGMKNASIEEAHRSVFPTEATAWIQSNAAKDMLLLMKRESTAAPLNFLTFLQSPLLLIAQALAHSECSQGLDSFLAAQHTATASTSTPTNRSTPQSDHTNDSNAGVFLRRLIYNLSCAFDNRCRCFIEESEKVCVMQTIKSVAPAVIGVEAGAGIEVGVEVEVEAGVGAGAKAGAGAGVGVEAGAVSASEAETEADKRMQLSLKTSRTQIRGKTNDGAEQESQSQSKPKTKDRNCTLHIFVSLPLSSFNPPKGTNHTAIHICIPSLTSSTTSTAPSTPSMKKRRDSITDLSKKGKKSPVLKDSKNDALVFEKTHFRKNVKLPFIQLLECASEVGMKNECPESDRIVEEERVQAFISAFVNVVLYTVSLDL